MSDPHGRKIHMAIVLVSTIMFSALVWRTYTGEQPPGSDGPAPVVVEIKGDVPAPGTYLLENERATVLDALSSAGLPVSVEGGARGLESGESLIVTSTDGRTRVFIARMPASACLAAGLKLDLNSASEDDLMLVPQMRREVAAAIVQRRGEKPWGKVTDLAEIGGIGLKTVQKLEGFLEVAPDVTR